MNLDKVRLIGRVMPIEDTLWLALSGTGVEFIATGAKVRITFVADDTWSGVSENRARIAVYVDGIRTVDRLLDKQEVTITAFEEGNTATHLVRVIKLSESAMSTCGIAKIETDGTIRPTECREKLIEFVGDSITCGYGVDDEDRDHHFATGTEDMTRAYAYKTAEWLLADYSMVSFSGYGIVSGYTATGDKMGHQLVPDYYEKFGFSCGTYLGKYKPQDFSWEFSVRQPDVVVVNLGTNDMSYVLDKDDRREEFINGYMSFLKTIEERNPGASVVCTLGVMGEALCPAVEEAIARYKKNRNTQSDITFVGIDDQLPEDGYVADWHPTETTHKKVAEKLVQKVKVKLT